MQLSAAAPARGLFVGLRLPHSVVAGFQGQPWQRLRWKLYQFVGHHTALPPPLPAHESHRCGEKWTLSMTGSPGFWRNTRAWKYCHGHFWKVRCATGLSPVAAVPVPADAPCAPPVAEALLPTTTTPSRRRAQGPGCHARHQLQ